MSAESGLGVTELNVTGVSLIEEELIMVRLIAMRLETMSLGKKFKKRLSPKNCLSPER